MALCLQLEDMKLERIQPFFSISQNTSAEWIRAGELPHDQTECACTVLYLVGSLQCLVEMIDIGALNY